MRIAFVPCLHLGLSETENPNNMKTRILAKLEELSHPILIKEKPDTYLDELATLLFQNLIISNGENTFRL